MLQYKVRTIQDNDLPNRCNPNLSPESPSYCPVNLIWKSNSSLINSTVCPMSQMYDRYEDVISHSHQCHQSKVHDLSLRGGRAWALSYKYKLIRLILWAMGWMSFLPSSLIQEISPNPEALSANT